MPEHTLDELIDPANPPAGCTAITLRRGDADERILAARDVTAETTELAADHRGTCAGPIQVLRFPTTGLNLPGEVCPVGMLVWCEEHGMVDQRLDLPTPQERAWNWHIPTLV